MISIFAVRMHQSIARRAGPLVFLSTTGKLNFSIPLHEIEHSYSRSSGPGGQNVNKVNTKAEIRFHVPSASWMPEDVRKRLVEYFPNKINKEGELIITSQEHRYMSFKRVSFCIIVR